MSKKRNIARVLSVSQKSTKVKCKKARIMCKNLTIRLASLMTPLQRPSTGTRGSRSISRNWRRKLKSSKGHISMERWPWVIKISRSNVSMLKKSAWLASSSRRTRSLKRKSDSFKSISRTSRKSVERRRI